MQMTDQREKGAPLTDAGFTLIELLVAILIIGILAAIAIPSFLSQRGKAVDTNTKALVRTAQLAEETYYTDNQAYVSTAVPLVTIESTLGPVTSLVAAAPNTNPLGATTPAGAPAETVLNSFDVEVTSPTGVVYAIVRHSDGSVDRVCDVPVATVASGCRVAAPASAGLGRW
jgi:type IV pilus assembly protein PilA